MKGYNLEVLNDIEVLLSILPHYPFFNSVKKTERERVFFLQALKELVCLAGGGRIYLLKGFHNRFDSWRNPRDVKASDIFVPP